MILTTRIFIEYDCPAKRKIHNAVSRNQTRKRSLNQKFCRCTFFADNLTHSDLTKRCAMLSYFIATPSISGQWYAFQFADFQSSLDRAGWSPENWIRDGTSWDSRRSLRAILESLLLATASLSCSTKYTSAPFRARTLGIKSNQLTNFRGFRHEKPPHVFQSNGLRKEYTGSKCKILARYPFLLPNSSIVQNICTNCFRHLCEGRKYSAR